MSRKKRRRRKKQTANQEKPRVVARSGFVLSEHPFSRLPRDRVIDGLIKVGETSERDFSAKLTALQQLCGSIEPLQTIASLSVYGLFATLTSTGTISPSLGGGSVNQSHVELLQALLLREPADALEREPPSPNAIQQVFDLLPAAADAFHLRRLAELKAELSADEKAVRVVQEELRIHTQTVRNWGFLSRVISITQRLCEPLDAIFVPKIGLSGVELITLFHHLARRNQRMVNARITRFRSVFSKKTVSEVIRAYYQCNPGFKDNADSLMAFAEAQHITLDQIKSLLLAHSDLSLAEGFTFRASELADEIGLDESRVIQALDHLSMRFGDDAGTPVEYLFMANPVWLKPVIALSEKRYFCALPQVFFSFVFPILAEILEGDGAAADEYARRRAAFLETETHAQFINAFPDCEIVKGYTWSDGDTQYESDLLVKIDSHLIIVEAKSGAVSWPALRGAAGRAKKHVEELLLAPSIQSLRLADRIAEVCADTTRCDTLLPHFPFAFEEIRTVVRLSVTLDDFATLQTTLHHAKDAGWIPAEHPIAPCMLLADLEIVFDVLPSTAHKIHYLRRRADLETNLSYKGDELDLLGFYLASGFNIGEAEFSGAAFNLVSMSSNIDTYYSAMEEGVQRKKPAPNITKWWSDICKKIEERDFHQWSDVATILLGFSLDQQKKLATKFRRIAKNVMKNWQQPSHHCSIIVIPPKGKADALAVYAFRDQHRAQRNSRMENIASQVFGSSHVSRCLILAINIDRNNYPYSSIAVYFRLAKEQLERRW